jgi:hypothetical protein
MGRGAGTKTFDFLMAAARPNTKKRIQNFFVGLTA